VLIRMERVSSVYVAGLVVRMDVDVLSDLCVSCGEMDASCVVSRWIECVLCRACEMFACGFGWSVRVGFMLCVWVFGSMSIHRVLCTRITMKRTHSTPHQNKHITIHVTSTKSSHTNPNKIHEFDPRYKPNHSNKYRHIEYSAHKSHQYKRITLRVTSTKSSHSDPNKMHKFDSHYEPTYSNKCRRTEYSAHESH
jgi:hypothetical protein